MSVSVEPWRGGFRDGVASCASRSRWKSRTASFVSRQPPESGLASDGGVEPDLADAVGVDILRGC